MAALLVIGCQWITGAKERTFLAAQRSSAQNCRPAGCGDAGVCLDGVCRAACRSDAECDPGLRCLQTSLGAACVEPAAAACGDGGPQCPDGTACAGGECRTLCSPISLPCLVVGQACRDSVCVGSDPAHDRAAVDGGTQGGGVPGSGGASSGGSATASGGATPTTASGGRTTTSGGTTTTGSGGSTTMSGGATMAGNGGHIISSGGATTTSSGGQTTATGGATMTGSGGSTTTAGCSDGRKDGSETDIDCGGPDCPRCDDGKRCKLVSDCASGTCNACAAACSPCTAGEACACGSAPVSIGDACYVLHLRGGIVVEAESSLDFCDPATPSIIPRPNDVTLVYVQTPPSQSVSVISNVSSEMPTWAARCTNALQSRADVLAQLGATWGPSTTPDPDMIFLGVSTNCPVAAVYRMQW